MARVHEIPSFTREIWAPDWSDEMCVLGVCLDVAIDVANETHERENKRYDENARGDDSGGEATDKKSKDLGQSPQALHQQHWLVRERCLVFLGP